MQRRSVLLAGLAGAGAAFAQQSPQPRARASGPGVAPLQAPPQPVPLDYPKGPITLVVPFPPGGPTDGSARVFAKSISAQLGQPVTVENRAGAGGTTGTAYGAAAQPDGYTLLWGGTSGLVVAPALYANLSRKLAYDPTRSFAPIAMAVRSPMLLVGNKRVPAAALKDLSANRKVWSVATAGAGSVGHLTLAYLQEFMPLAFNHVPYKGGAPALADLLAGQVELLFDSVQFLAPQVKQGKVKAFATTGAKRSPSLPDVPTVGELLGKSFEAYSWFGLVAPAETPRRIVRALNAAMNKATEDPEVQAYVDKLGLEAVAGDQDMFARTVLVDYFKWAGVSARSNIIGEP
jgi:tripartite-type tricarboxylate transporter receptor subunit TctC